MRVKRKGIAALVGLMITAMGFWGLSTVVKRTSSFTPPESSPGYRLVSIQQVPDLAEICLPEEEHAGAAARSASFDKNDGNDVLALLRGTSVYDASTGIRIPATAPSRSIRGRAKYFFRISTCGPSEYSTGRQILRPMPCVLNRSGSFRVKKPSCNSTPACTLTRRTVISTR